MDELTASVPVKLHTHLLYFVLTKVELSIFDNFVLIPAEIQNRYTNMIIMIQRFCNDLIFCIQKINAKLNVPIYPHSCIFMHIYERIIILHHCLSLLKDSEMVNNEK